MPGKYASNLIFKEKAYMQWKIYKIREYKNITRCYKCHAFGHIAKACNSPDQLCETCGSKDHIKKDCNKSTEPQCLNCVRMKRTDHNHHIKSRDCPEFKKHLEWFDNKIKWD